VSPRPSVEEERRKQILEAACEAIAERGFAAVRIFDIARKAGTSTGTVHYYFDTRQEVLHQALRYAFEQSLSRMIRETARMRSARRKLIRLIDLNLPEDQEIVQDWLVWMEFDLEALREPALQRVNDELYGQWRALVLAVIEEGQQQGDFDASADATDVANQFVALMDGLATQVLLKSPQIPAAEMRRLCVDFIEARLATPAGDGIAVRV
jgi:AcrR family transcriptional regulator